MDDSKFLSSYLNIIEGLPDDCAIPITKMRRMDSNIVKRFNFIEKMITEGFQKSHSAIFTKILHDIQSFQRRKFEHAENLRMKIVNAHENFEKSLIAVNSTLADDNLDVLARCAGERQKLAVTEKIDSVCSKSADNSDVSLSSSYSHDNNSKCAKPLDAPTSSRKKRGRIPNKLKKPTEGGGAAHGMMSKEVENVNEAIKKKVVKKKQIRSETEEEDNNEPLYCLCNRPSFGNMIECSNEQCNFEWFHFACIGLKKRAPKGKWYCPKCRSNHRPKVLKKEYRSGKI